MRCKIPFLLVVILCSIVQVKDIVDLQKFSEIKNDGKVRKVVELKI